jgi:hypothetical protein
MADNITITAPVGRGISSTGKRAVNNGPDVKKIADLLNRIPVAQGGWKGRADGRLLPVTETMTNELHQAIVDFQRKQYAGWSDGVVDTDKKTLRDMNRTAEGGGGSSLSPDMQLVNAADMRRLAALVNAEQKLAALKADFEPGVPDEDNPVVKALQRQLFVPLDSSFWSVVDQLLSMIRTNRLTRAPFLIDKTSNEFAHVDRSNQPGQGITFCASFFNTNDNCRQEVVTHEFFHFIVGLQHFYETSVNSEAMRCPHHLARAVFDIALGQQLAPCSASGNVCK